MTLKLFIKMGILSPVCAAISFLTAPKLPADLWELDYYKTYTLQIPTYENSGQAVHPDVMRDPVSNEIMMAYTPYPFSIDRYENPSLAVSVDGLRFHVEKGTINPLAAPPHKDHNDDPDLFFENGKWNIMYLETLRPETQNLRLLQSADRKTWTNTVLVSMDLRKTETPFILSPAYIKSPYGAFVFYVNMNYPGNRIECAGMNESLSPDFNSSVPVPVDMHGLHPWHIDILSDGSVYYMLISTVDQTKTGEKKYSLNIARSADLENWELSEKVVLGDSYRASALISGGDLFVYYSREEGLWGAWKIGVYRVKVSDFFWRPICALR